jgi:exodeoxyribonuclease VII large subunit
VRGIRIANALPESPDVLVVGRGGGSMEDLWCFNEEPVVRAIHASRIPVVSAVGHEIDVTLADLVADVRALTPSDAAARIVPSAEEIRTGLDGMKKRLTAGLRGRLADARSRLAALAQDRVFRRPYDRVHDLARRLDDLEMRTGRAVRYQLSRCQERLGALAARLETLGPLGVLSRGYSLTQKADTGELVTDASLLATGDRIVSRFARGQVVSEVSAVQTES